MTNAGRDEGTQNPNVNFVYLACNAYKLPIKDNVLDMVTSFGGYENMAGGIISAIAESYRVLKEDGYLNSEIALVEDRDAEPTKRWLRLIEADPEMQDLLVKIFDLAQWNENITRIGFTQHKN